VTIIGPGVPVNRNANRAAHHAAMQQMTRRRATFTVVPPLPPGTTVIGPTNSLGLDIAHQWTITEATLDDGPVH
jgi:hypothetical protein